MIYNLIDMIVLFLCLGMLQVQAKPYLPNNNFWLKNNYAHPQLMSYQMRSDINPLFLSQNQPQQPAAPRLFPLRNLFPFRFLADKPSLSDLVQFKRDLLELQRNLPVIQASTTN